MTATLGLVLAVSGVLAAQPSHPDPALTRTFDQISMDQIRQHLAVLAHDSLGGRGTGAEGGEKAARYIALQLRSFGLMPAGDNQTFFQHIPFHGGTPLPESHLTLSCRDSSLTLNLWEDYILFDTGPQTFVPPLTPMVFAGYGIFAPEYDYNDYLELEVENRMVVYLAGEPPSLDPDFFDGPQTTIHSDPIMKHRIALARGASGTILLPLPRGGDYVDWEYWKQQFLSEDIRLEYGVTNNLNLIVNLETAPCLFRGSQYTLEDVLSFDSTGSMRSFPLHVTAAFRGKFLERDFVASNVVGLLRGNDHLLRDSYLIVSAHYDHLGIGPPVDGDSIYNGLVDNAIGVSAVLEMARLFGRLTTPLDRSVLFLFLTGEEKGLLGSRYYCDHPIVPLSKTIAALNVDGLAIYDCFNSIYGIGVRHSTLGDQLGMVAEELGLTLASGPPFSLDKDPLTRSDQLSFAQAGIPSILIMEGPDYRNVTPEEGIRAYIQWGEDIYHTPFDDLHQEIHFEAVHQHIQILLAFAWETATAYMEPQWVPGSMYMNARLQSIAEER